MISHPLRFFFSCWIVKAHVGSNQVPNVFRPTYLPIKKVGHAMMFGNFSPNFNLKKLCFQPIVQSNFHGKSGPNSPYLEGGEVKPKSLDFYYEF